MTGRGATPHVVVVGAGPTGLVVAGLLAPLGVTSTVVDRYAEPYPRPRAVHLDGAAVRVLQRLGVHEEFTAISRPATGLRLLDASMRPFAQFRRDPAPGPHGHPEANLFDQPDLETILRAATRRRPGVTLRGGQSVTAITNLDGPRVHIDLRDVATGRRTQLHADAVLGCDGADSTVRSAIGARLRDLGFTQRWLVVDVVCRTPLDTWGGVDQVCDPHRAATFMHLTGDRYRIELRMHAEETEADLTAPGALAALTAPWLGAVPRGEWEVLRSAQYTFRAQIADHWRVGRALLLGDAAHLMPPFIGQGLGCGIGDAHNLAWKLAAVLHGRARDELLETYQGEREPHAREVTRAAVRIGRAMTGGQDVVAALRRPVVAALLRLPGAEARALTGIATRYPASPWVDRRTLRSRLPGTVCPQPVVRVDERRALLDDVLGDGFALISAGPVEPRLLRRARELGAHHMTLGPDRDSGTAVTDDGTLRTWLRRGRVGAALLRPDRVVLGTG